MERYRESSTETYATRVEAKRTFHQRSIQRALVLYRRAMADATQKTELLEKAGREIGTTRFSCPTWADQTTSKSSTRSCEALKRSKAKRPWV